MSGSSSSSETGGTKKPPNTKKKKERGIKVDLSSFLKGKEPTEEATKGPNEKAKATSANSKKTAAGAANEKTSAEVVSAVSTACVPVEPVNAAETIAAAVSTAPVPSSATAPTRGSPTTTGTPKSPTKPAPKLKDVVKAASASSPAPNPVIMRPNLQKKPTSGVQNTTPVSVVPGISYAQQVSGSANKSSPVIEIIGSFVTPCPPPPDFGKSRLKSGAKMQELFEARWQDDRYGMHIEHIRGSTQSAYLKAIYSVIPSDELFSFGLVGRRGMVEVYTTTIEAASKLMLEGIDVGGRHLSPFPVSVKPTRVVFSRVPIRINQEDLLGFLRKFGKVHGKARPMPLKLGDEGLGKGVLSTTWEAFITLNQGCVLPPGFNLRAAGSRDYIEVATEAKCHACHQVGHFIAECPKRSRKVAEVAAKGTPVPAVVSVAAPSPGAAPALEGTSSNKMPEDKSEETNKLAETGVTSMREGATSSDEEHLDKKVKRKRLTKRKPKKPELEVMAPPAPLADAETKKRKLSDDGSPLHSPKALAVDTSGTTARLSEEEVMAVTEVEGPPPSDYESCGSTLSIGSGFEVVKELNAIPRERLRSLLDSLNYKKSSDRIWSILKSQLENPEQILPQLKLLQHEAKKRRKYNEASRCERLFSKISSIIEERKIEGTLRQ